MHHSALEFECSFLSLPVFGNETGPSGQFQSLKSFVKVHINICVYIIYYVHNMYNHISGIAKQSVLVYIC